MNWWLLLIPFAGALIGWMANLMVVNTLIKRILPSKQSSVAQQVGKLAASEMLSFDEIEKKIAGPEAMEKIMPLVEGHIDNFLRNKLAQAFPMISMFIGDKTINQLKEIFMKEMQEIFPKLMKSYVQNLRADIDIEKMVSEKIASFPPEKLEAGIRQNLGKELRSFELVGAGAGFLTGIVQVLLSLAIA